MISLHLLETAMFEAMKKAALLMPPDVRDALVEAVREEEAPIAREHLQVTLENADLAEKGQGLVCGDTGFPLYFIRVVGAPEIEGGFQALRRAARRAVIKATGESYLRPTMVDPITRENPGNNMGNHIPGIDIDFAGGNGERPRLEIVAAPKGGGSEIFGTFYRMMYPADGMSGVLKFIVDSVRRGSYAGKVCPPAIVGVGIGGTSDICMKIAKRAALLRLVGSKHPDPQIASLEKKLEKGLSELGVGPMGAEGRGMVLAIHIEKEVTHTAALPVAVNAQCCIGRRWAVTIPGDARTEGDLIFDSEVPEGLYRPCAGGPEEDI